MVDSDTRKVNGYHKPVRLSKIKRWIKSGKISESDIKKVVYNIPSWKYGWSAAMTIEKTQKNVILYVTKYIEKDVQGVNKIMGKRYWSSRNIEICPVIELENVNPSDFEKINAKEYSNKWDGKKYKYLNNWSNKIL